MELVGLGDKASAYPAQLSADEVRVAIARALATNPTVCDEATSALIQRSTGQILDLIRDINKNLGSLWRTKNELRLAVPSCHGRAY